MSKTDGFKKGFVRPVPLVKCRDKIRKARASRRRKRWEKNEGKE